MIRFRLGKSKRLAAFLCALLLTLETVAFPLTRAKAAATAALATVGFGVTTAAFLAACGIYPYWADDSSAVDFDWEEWVDDDLTALVNEYNAANSTTPINPNQISAFLSGATLLVGNYAWQRLCDFAEWVKTKYAVADNQTGTELGAEISGMISLSVGSSVPVGRYNDSEVSILRQDSTYQYYLCYAPRLNYESQGQCAFVITTQPVPQSPFYAPGGAFQLIRGSRISLINDSVSYRDIYFGWSYPLSSGTLNGSIPAFSNYKEAVDFYISNGGAPSFLGITADTSTVSIPDALPQGTEYGGLRVSGLPAATTAESVTDAVQDSVGERLKTPVEVVEVELAPGTEVDSETGAITQNPVVIEAPTEETIPALSALAPPQEFIQTMTTALQTKFPFCLPFDFMRVLRAFVKPPDAPVITMTFNDRIGGGTYAVTVDLEPWDDIAAIVRRLESMILFLGFWLNFDKFNVLNIILGQIG